MGCGSSSEVPSRPGFSFRHEGYESDVKAKRAAHAAMLLRHHGPKNLMAREALFLLTELYSCKTDVQLGEGAFGSVFTAQRHSDRKEFAVKMALFSSNSREDLLEEINQDPGFSRTRSPKHCPHPSRASIIKRGSSW